MEENRSIWKETLKYGVILGLISVVVSVLTYMLDLTYEKWIFLPSVVISIIVLFLLLRSYRDQYNHGYISYGKSVGAGVIMNIYSALITAVYIYLLYTVIDTGMIDKQLSMTESKMIEKGVPEASLPQIMEMQAKFVKPWFITMMSILSSVFFGLILSLLASIFVMKQGNPLLEEEVKE